MHRGVDRALANAEESRRLNVRALGTPETGTSLRGGLDALEHCSVAVRSLFRSIYDATLAGVQGDADHSHEVRRRTLVATVDRMLLELDTEEHARPREGLHSDALARRKAAQAVQRLRSTTRHLIDQPVPRREPEAP